MRARLKVADHNDVPRELQDAVEVVWESPSEQEVERSAEDGLIIKGSTKATITDMPKGLSLADLVPGVRAQGATDFLVGEIVVRHGESA